MQPKLVALIICNRKRLYPKREKGNKMGQSRFKSWALWVSVAGLIFLVLTKVVGLQIDAGVWGEVLDGVGVVLIGFGIVNNPTNKSGI